MLASDTPPVPPIACTLSERRNGATIQIAGEIRAEAPRAGTYRLTVVKVGPSGRAQVNQQSAFALDAGGAVAFQGPSISLEREARYRAVLSVEAGGEAWRCERSGPDESDRL